MHSTFQTATKLIGFAWIGLLVGACSDTPTTLTQTNSGPVQGIVIDTVSLYRGIPYAAPPIADLRWRAPQAVEPWSDVLAAAEFGPACWQDNSGGNAQFLERLTSGAGMGGFTTWMLTTFSGAFELPLSEDCLTLNIAAPNQAEQPLPVMFWIHGGGHAFGSGGGPYESVGLAKKGVVLVSINYRLGLYGFFSHPELVAEDEHGSTGNYGMLDQIAALHWVRENIANFGGDPNNITIFGESAGGHSVGQLMASPLSKGLFQRAIAQSGTGFYQFQATAEAYERMSGLDAGLALAKRLGVESVKGADGTNQISALRNLSTEDLAVVAGDPELSATYHPQIDGYVLPSSTAHIFAAGEQARVPLIVGSNADEGSILYHFGMTPVDGGPPTQPTDTAEWEDLLASQFGDQATQVALHYAVDTDQQVSKAAQTLMGDTWFGRHAYYMAQSHAAAGHPTYLYFYERHPPSEQQTIGASHALELNHVFDGLIPGWPTDQRDDELRGQMQGYWSSFAKNGNPNDTTLPIWPNFDALNAQELALGHDQSQARPVSRQARYRAMYQQFTDRMGLVQTLSNVGGG